MKEMSTTMQFFAVIGMIAMAVTVVPVLVLLISSAPDIVRYIRLIRM